MGQGTSTVAEKGEQGIQGIPGKDMKEWGEWTEADKQNFLTSIGSDEKFKTAVKDKLSTDEGFRTMIATVAKGDQAFVKKLTELLLSDNSFKSDVGKAVNDDAFKNAISTQVVQAYNSNNDFKTSVQSFLAGNAPFQKSVGTTVSSDSGFKVSIINALKSDTVFASSIKGEKGNDSTVVGPIGPAGEGLATLEVTPEGMATVTTTSGRKFAPFNVKSTIPGPPGRNGGLIEGLPQGQGSYASWNTTCGNSDIYPGHDIGCGGDTNFINQQGNGRGGFRFVNFNSNNTFKNVEMETDGSGNLNVNGQINAKGTVTVQGRDIIRELDNIQSGTQAGNGDPFGTGRVNFPRRFESAPKVFVSVQSDSTDNVYEVHVLAVDRNGFNFARKYSNKNGGAWTPGGDTFHWLAVA